MKTLKGVYSDGDPPLPIPNREVKPVSADGTADRWESRSMPNLEERASSSDSPFFYIVSWRTCNLSTCNLPQVIFFITFVCMRIRTNIISIGLILLALFIAAIYLIGKKISDVGNDMK